MSNLTKEECSLLLALRCHNCKYQFTCNGCLIHKKLEQLINEHFDNPPLKFEELKEGMWVWDVKNAEWVCIDRPIANVSYCKNLSGLVIFFEENRFYRKQVQEDVN